MGYVPRSLAIILSLVLCDIAKLDKQLCECHLLLGRVEWIELYRCMLASRILPKGFLVSYERLLVIPVRLLELRFSKSTL